jgi:hypothetical protein
MDLEPGLMGLAGECGELIDLHKKAKFKLGFELTREMELDELGDIWYYLRIVAYQINCGFSDFAPAVVNQASVNEIIISMYDFSGNMLDELLFTAGHRSQKRLTNGLLYIYENLIIRLTQLDCTLDELTELNWQKLSKREDMNKGYGFKHA